MSEDEYVQNYGLPSVVVDLLRQFIASMAIKDVDTNEGLTAWFYDLIEVSKKHVKK